MSSSLASTDKHCLSGVPGSRALACKACRKKKHHCDKKQPFCTSCVNVGTLCIYPGRKVRVTASDLEYILQKLERKYAAAKCQKSRRHSARAKPSISTSTDQNQIDAIFLTDRAPIHSVDSDGNNIVQFPNSKTTPAQNDDIPGGGYHFDESFLKMPSFNSGPSSQYRETYHQSDHASSLAHLSTYPTLTFKPTTRSPPISSTSPINFREDLRVPSKVTIPENDKTEVWSPMLTRLQSDQLPPVLDDPLKQREPQVQSSSTSLPCISSAQVIPQDSNCLTSRQQRRSQTPQETGTDITRAPSLHFSRATWWDCLLHTYTIFPHATYSGISHCDAPREISQDVCIFFRSAPLWLSCMNVPRFFDMFHCMGLRAWIQPALVLSILAYSKFIQSNRDGVSSEQDIEERERAWRQSAILRDLAQASFEASYNAGWIDLSLAQAAWILALYEMSPHRDCSLCRSQASITLLDNTIHILGLTSIDAMDPRAPTFAAGVVPALGRPLPNGVTYAYPARQPGLGDPSMVVSGSPHSTDSSSSSIPRYHATVPLTTSQDRQSIRDRAHTNYASAEGAVVGCPCEALSLAGSPEVLRSTPTWATMPRWTADASWADIRKEEARRLVWSSVVILATDANARQACGTPLLDLYVSKAENFALLFPGEENYPSLPDVDIRYSGKESNWALWGRTLLLWFSCVRRAARPSTALPGLTNSSTLTENESRPQSDVDFAKQTWIETVAIEEALDAHSCKTEQAMMFQARKYIFTIRMQISGGFQQFTPVPQTGVNFSQLDRGLVIKWVNQQDMLATSLLTAVSKHPDNPRRKIFVRRPFLVYLCLAAVWRSLEILRLDPSLSLVSDVALKFHRAIKWYQQIWPCPGLHKWAEKALGELECIRNTLG